MLQSFDKNMRRQNYKEDSMVCRLAGKWAKMHLNIVTVLYFIAGGWFHMQVFKKESIIGVVPSFILF